MSRPDGQTLFFSLAIVEVVLNVLVPPGIIIPPPFTYCGLLLIGSGLALGLWCRTLLIRHRTTLSPFESPTVLIISGPFRVSRNPVYLSMAFMLAGLAVLIGNSVLFLIPVLFVIIMCRTFIPAEERLLETTFGEHYQRYQQNVSAGFEPAAWKREPERDTGESTGSRKTQFFRDIAFLPSLV